MNFHEFRKFFIIKSKHLHTATASRFLSPANTSPIFRVYCRSLKYSIRHPASKRAFVLTNLNSIHFVSIVCAFRLNVYTVYTLLCFCFWLSQFVLTPCCSQPKKNAINAIKERKRKNHFTNPHRKPKR